jgi:DNA-binding response OmpR family regulator
VIDDEPDVILVCRLNFEHAGHRVLEAASAEEGLDTALAERPDVIVLDIMLPHRDGFSLLEELVARPETAGVPIVLLTAKSQLADRARGWGSGASGYITKPFSPSSLNEAIDLVAGMSPVQRQTLRERVLEELDAAP